ncbi:MAG: glycoside hydrolase family 65 protein [Verrucomicrobia bacterium]|nr:glycoside hydrolase family 65 protein [Verrucomicrobiota bacterium]
MVARRVCAIVKKEHDAESRRAHASVFTIANGYMAFKGDLAEERGLLEERNGRHAATLINGVFDTADMIGQIPVSKHERRYLDEDYFDGAGPSPSVANLPNPLAVRVFVGDDELVFERGRITRFSRTYELDRGLYGYAYTHTDCRGRKTRIAMQRFCDMANVHRAFMRYSVTPLNYSGTVRIMSGIDAAVRSNLTGDRQIDVVGGWPVSRDKASLLMEARTAHTGIHVKLAVRNVFARKPFASPLVLSSADSLFALYEFRARPNNEIRLDKTVIVACERDTDLAVYRDAAASLGHAQSDPVGFDAVLDANAGWWRDTWKRLDVTIHGDKKAQLALRFCLFHLMCAAPRHADAASVPCKLLTGEHYQGTTFYDTDLYIEPVFTFTFPDVARRMLAYRHAGLGPGRAIATDLGCKGAKLAWQSGPDGIEALGKWYVFTHTNIHINSDVAYSLMQYLDATGDWRFMRERGAELLVETARFYASRARRNTDGSYSFLDVAGPDEGHCHSTDNVYTNLLAQKNLRAAIRMLGALRRDHREDYTRLVNALAIGQREPAEWRRVANGLRILYDPETKLYEQYDGFYELEPAPADLLEGRTQWFATVAPYQALNQPDVVMAHVLLRDEIPDDVKRANWAYYRHKSMNFSSMSFGINSIMAAIVGEMDEAYRSFMRSAAMDLDPTLTGRGDTGDGLHGTAMGAAWMAAVFGFGGITLSNGRLLVEPRLPKHWKSLAFTLQIQGESFRFTITPKRVLIKAGKRRSVTLPARIMGRNTVLRSGCAFSLESAR